ncbi:MAG: sigma-70 family RNA polymerase sigma factor, partial [Planctomycetota bacterium]
DSSVRGELLNLTQERLLRLTSKMKQNFRGVGRWEQTEDVYQNAAMRLYQAIHECPVQDLKHYYRLAALQIRRELLDMCRHYRGPMGQGANHATQMKSDSRPAAVDVQAAPQGAESTDMSAWSEFHQAVEELPQAERDVFEMTWYHDLKQDEIAKVLDVSTRTVKRLWRSARLLLHESLSDQAGQSVQF